MKDKSSGPGQGSALVSPENCGMHQEVMIPPQHTAGVGHVPGCCPLPSCRLGGAAGEAGAGQGRIQHWAPLAHSPRWDRGAFSLNHGFSHCKPIFFHAQLPMDSSKHLTPTRPCEGELHCCSAVCNKPPASHHAPNTGIHQELPSPGKL